MTRGLAFERVIESMAIGGNSPWISRRFPASKGPIIGSEFYFQLLADVPKKFSAPRNGFHYLPVDVMWARGHFNYDYRSYPSYFNYGLVYIQVKDHEMQISNFIKWFMASLCSYPKALFGVATPSRVIFYQLNDKRMEYVVMHLDDLTEWFESGANPEELKMEWMHDFKAE